MAIAVIAITAAIIAYGRIEEKARIVQAKGEITQLAMALELVKTNVNRLVLDLNLATGQPPGGVAPVDPWNRPYLAALLFPAAGGTATVYHWSAQPDGLWLVSTGRNRPAAVQLKLRYPDGSTTETAIAPADLPAHIPLPADPPVRIELEITPEAGKLETGIAVFGYRLAGLTSFPAESLPVAVSPNRAYVLFSSGADREPGGEGINEDIIWRSDYGGFLD
jgi:hypothetical protein